MRSDHIGVFGAALLTACWAASCTSLSSDCDLLVSCEKYATGGSAGAGSSSGGMSCQMAMGAVSSQVYGDCKTDKCDDKGKLVTQNDDNDVYDDGNPCTSDWCSFGMPSNTLVMTGTSCSNPDNPQLIFCDANARCVQCVDNKGCMTNPATPMCLQGQCVPTTCNNMQKDGTETGPDCGGLCNPCADLVTCIVPKDCLSGICKGPGGNKTCAPPACGDNVKNGQETDIDCGGTDCVPLGGLCDTPQHCKHGTDCVSHVCKAGLCQPPACTDGVQNGMETAIDCGGPCPACLP